MTLATQVAACLDKRTHTCNVSCHPSFLALHPRFFQGGLPICSSSWHCYRNWLSLRTNLPQRHKAVHWFKDFFFSFTLLPPSLDTTCQSRGQGKISSLATETHNTGNFFQRPLLKYISFSSKTLHHLPHHMMNHPWYIIIFSIFIVIIKYKDCHWIDQGNTSHSLTHSLTFAFLQSGI